MHNKRYRVLPVTPSVAGFLSSKGSQFWFQTPSNYKCNAYSVFKQKKPQKNKQTTVHKKYNFHFELILHLLHLLMTSYSKQTCLNLVIKLAIIYLFSYVYKGIGKKPLTLFVEQQLNLSK